MSSTNDGDTSSDPAYIIIASEYDKIISNIYMNARTYLCLYSLCILIRNLKGIFIDIFN